MVMPVRRTAQPDPLTASHDRFVERFARRPNGNYTATVDGMRMTVFYKRGRWGWVVDDNGARRWSRWDGFDTQADAVGDLWRVVYVGYA